MIISLNGLKKNLKTGLSPYNLVLQNFNLGHCVLFLKKKNNSTLFSGQRQSLPSFLTTGSSYEALGLLLRNKNMLDIVLSWHYLLGTVIILQKFHRYVLNVFYLPKYY